MKIYLYTLTIFYAGLLISCGKSEYKEIKKPSPQPEPAPVQKEIKKKIIKSTVRSGDNIIGILTRNGLSVKDSYKFIQDTKKTFNFRRLTSGSDYSILYSDNMFKGFTLSIDRLTKLKVIKEENEYRAEIVKLRYTSRKVLIESEIQYSLFGAITTAGERPELADLLAKLYEYDIDFNRDIRSGDSFKVLVEKKFIKDKFICYGRITASQFTNRGRTIKIISYTDPSGHTAFYHPDGRAVKKMFLRCPLPFMRVTSRYGRRKHPVLGFSSKHNGVDFGAPRGTKIRAAASGTVIKRGYTRVKGKFIVIRHPNRYETHYYHLSRFTNASKRGRRVNQSDIIGYVGNTGRSTGPHLHYGIKKGRRFINPLSLKPPSKSPVRKIYRTKFYEYSDTVFKIMNNSWQIPDYIKPIQINDWQTI